MLSRLANVLQELSGEEGADGNLQDVLTPQLPGGEVHVMMESEAPEEAMDRLAHLEQLVVQLKELIRDRDTQLVQKDTDLAKKDAQLKSEKEEAETRFTKLKLQAKAKMASLNKQITELKGSGGGAVTQSPDSSFTAVGAAVEEELQELKKRLSEEEAKSSELQRHLQNYEQLLREKESAHAEQLQKLQAVVCEKDVRFQEQIQKHEEELMKVTAESQNEGELQEALHAAQRRCEEQEEALRSRGRELEMLQEEVSSADQQKQILTAQFRQMEQELAEAVRLRLEERQQWLEHAGRADAELSTLRSSLEALEGQKAELGRQESELISLREAERLSQEALEQQKVEVDRLEKELALSKEAELAAVEASERERSRLEGELASVREMADHASQDAAEREKSETEKLEKEREEARKKEEILVEVWRHLRAVAGADEPTDEVISDDLFLLVDTVQSIHDQLTEMKEKRSESEEHCAQLTHTMESLQEQLDRKTTEQEEATTKIQQLEHQIVTLSATENVTEVSSQKPSEVEKAHILALQQKLLDKENELSALQESLEQGAIVSVSIETSDETPDQDQESSSGLNDSPTALPELVEDTQDEDTTLVAEDTSVLSISAENDSSPEFIRQSESPEESKVTSSDEMVTSTDSEVAHSSWTLLEAVNQDGGQEWPSILQDVSQMQLQSWEATSMEQETSMVQVESSSSVVIRETVQVHVTKQSSSPTDSDVSSGHVFAQALAEELQKKYSELLMEVQDLREAASESQGKIMNLEEEICSLTAAKEEVESQADRFAEELKLVRVEFDNVSQQNTSLENKHCTEMQILEEQIDILSAEREAKEEKIQSLQSDLEKTQGALSDQDGQVRMLSAQLEDRELFTSELERRLQDMESSMMDYSQNSDLNNETLSKKDSEITDLQLRLSQKEQEMMELNDSMSARLLQVEEEKFQIDREANKLKEQVVELEKVREEKEQQSCEASAAAPVDEDLGSLRKEKKELETQLTNMRKKLQAALVQRKELMKKVANFEEDAKKRTEQEELAKVETPATVTEGEETGAHTIQELDAKLLALEQALRTKEATVEMLEQRLSQQDEMIGETLALNKKLSEEAETAQNASDDSPAVAELQRRVVILEAECETLQMKVQEAQESRKETIRKAKEKDRHHREQLKQQKEDYCELKERFEMQGGERDSLLTKLRELEDKASSVPEAPPHQEAKDQFEKMEKQAASVWVQEDWVDFAASETVSTEPQKSEEVNSAQMEESLNVLRKEIHSVQLANTELEVHLQETQATLSRKETELENLNSELQALREKEKQIDALSEEVDDLRIKYQQAESHAESLKAEMEAATKASSEESASSIAALQAEVEGFKQFLDNKNQEMMELSQQLGEQGSLIHSMQDTVSQKDQLITSLQEELKVEQEKSQKLEVEVPQKQEEEKDSEAKIQQLQQKLKAALISRKETLKENKTQKEQLASAEELAAELKQKLSSAGDELERFRAERLKLIDEVDKTLLENQSLGMSCESLKLAMEELMSEKNACKREAEFAKEEAVRITREWQEKVQSMKEEYETLLKSYENVSDEAERVRRVLEAARQERQDLAARVRTHEAAKQEAERQAEEAQKEVDTVKDKMRKFAKTKQQKILELEEENERLREMQEKSSPKPKDSVRKAEVERLEGELQSLKDELNAMSLEKDSLGKQVEELNEELDQMRNTFSSVTVLEEVITAQKSEAVMTKAELNESPDEMTDQPAVAVTTSQTQMQPSEEEEDTIQSAPDVVEDKVMETEAGVSTEMQQWQENKAELLAELASLERDLEVKQSLLSSLETSLQESKERETNLIGECSAKEAEYKEHLKSLETEKDNLEERLMNQLAQLNGSIAGYQQEATDNQEQLTELRHKVERSEREHADLEVEIQNEKDRACRLEEDLRQTQRQRAEAEAECGKQRELQQQLTSAQRVKEGSQSRARQLEELLREKQLEVRQLQKDSIQYQERISELGKEAKTLHLGQNELNNKLKQSQLETFTAQEDLKKIEEELSNSKSQLEDVQKQCTEALAEKADLEQSTKQTVASIKAEAEQTLDSVRFRLGAELKEMELRLEDSYKEREKEEEATLKAKEMAENAQRRAQQLQARLDESMSRLMAFSMSMGSLQDDRDRVLDEARQWEMRFNQTLQAKEAEVQAAETRARSMAEALEKETALKEDLQLSVDRLEKSDKDWQLRMEEEEKKFADIQAVLSEEKAQLQQTTSELKSAQSEVLALTDELQGARHRVEALEEALGRLQGDVDRARAELSEREAEERRLCLNVEQLETDLRTSKALTESLQTELHEKERREVEMLVEKEQAVTQAADEARKEADNRAQEAEKELDQRREEVRDLEEKRRVAEEERNAAKTKLDTFTKAMGSLQDDRDRVLNAYKQLEEKHLQVMMEKDSLIQEAAAENNSLKEELRSLLIQRDDLYAEKAKLSAQLHGYRNELNQVLSMKDSQHKQLLAAQREKISSLEKECEALQGQLKSVSRAEEEAAVKVEVESLSQAADGVTPSKVIDAPGAEVEKLREQLQSAKAQVEKLEETLTREREGQDGRNKELAELRWEGGVMRTESESAQERVAELARDLLVVEQQLLVEKEATTQLKAEKQSFAKAMASLQDSRDQSVSQVEELRLKLEEVSKAGGHAGHSSSGGSTGEVWGLKNALQALQNDRERLLEELQNQSTELKKQREELARLGAGELIKVSQELYEERKKNEDVLGVVSQLENVVETGKQEVETLRLERIDWIAQAEQLKQQTLTTLSERDQQLRQLTALLEEARAQGPKIQQEQYQREGTEKLDSPPGAPQERSSPSQGHSHVAEVKELQRRLNEEMQLRITAEEQLVVMQEQLTSHSSAKWHSDQSLDQSETAVFIEPPEGGLTRSRRAGGPSLKRMLRVAFCSRQRTPLLCSLYLLTVHVLLLLCMGGYL